MTNTWAIAGVTTALTSLLERMTLDDPGLSPFEVTAKSPDRVLVDDAQLAKRKLNVFLYQVQRNAALANNDLPLRNSTGQLVGQPVVAIDLRYLLTAYGVAFDELDAQHLLAHALSLIHDNGVLRDDHIRAALAAIPGLATSGLADQIERITVAHEPLSDEDLFRMWTTFGTSYRVSVGCSASVVLVQRTRPTTVPAPVRSAAITVATARRPLVEELSPQPVTVGATLSIRGLNLSAGSVVVRLSAIEVTPSVARGDLIELTVPATLRAGPNSVQIVHEIALAGATGTRPYAVSDVVPFTLAPTITSSLPATAPLGGDMTLTVSPAVHRSQQVVALLGSVAVARRVASTDPDPTSTLVFAIPETFVAGDVSLRVQVDGAQSELTLDTAGNFADPKATVA